MLEEEWLEIQAQREARLGNDPLNKPNGDTLPTGLALSGGGIRSATLGLGVLQWICDSGKVKKKDSGGDSSAESPLIEHIDYLSTVSGGGYIGSWFAANRFREPGSGPPADDFINNPASAKLHHLRKYSRYLAPEAGLMSADTWTMVAVWFRNTVLIQLTVFCVVATLFLAARYWGLLVMKVSEFVQPERISGLLKGAPRLVDLGFMVIILGLLGYAALQVGRQLKMFEEDDKKAKQPGSKADMGELGAGQVMSQPQIQLKVVLPTLLSGLVLTFCVWWRNLRIPAPGGTDGWWRNWWLGRDTEIISLDPLVLVTCVCIGFLGLWLVLRARNKTFGGKRRVYFTVFVGVTVANLAMIYLLNEMFEAFKTMEVGAHVIGLGDPAWVKLHEYMLRCHPCESMPESDLMVSLGGALVAVMGPPAVIACYTVIVILGLGLMGRNMPDKVREWWSRLGAWLMIYGFAFLALIGVAVLGPLLVEWGQKILGSWLSTGVVSSWLAALTSAVFWGKSQKTGGTRDPSKFGILLAVLTFIAVTGLLIGAAWLLRFMLTPKQSPVDPFLNGAAFDLTQHIFVTILVPLLGAILVWRVDLNEFSMNQFYRNRLVRCYLGGSKSRRRFHPFTGFDFKDDLPLYKLRRRPVGAATEGTDFKGPYPLINAALNTAQGGELEVQERKAESFLFTPLHCGFFRRRLNEDNDPEGGETVSPLPCQGYRPTHTYMVDEDEKPASGSDEVERYTGLTLGTATSISGAAASPNSGYHTSPLMAFLLTIFNARLGAWLPNPAKEQWHRSALRGRQGLTYLMSELFGSATPKSSFVYVSDGGHFENLGIYELVRRRCRLIIVVDGEQDGDYSFHALGTAIRRCRVDFDTEIQINVSDIKPSAETGWSTSHGAVGKIRYPAIKDALGKIVKPQEKGIIVYLKSSLTGDEETDIRQYKALSPFFPHESTGDQFFSESQFESYRSLGRHMAEEMFGSAFKRRRRDRTDNLIAYLMEELRERWFHPARAPAGVFTQHTAVLDGLWAELCRPGMPACLGELMLTEWQGFQNTLAQKPANAPWPTPAPLPTDAQELHAAYAFCERLIQLMENVYLDLHLDSDGDHMDNLGWMNLFKHWVQQDIMKAAWKNSKNTFGERFGKFWDDLEHAPLQTSPVSKAVNPAANAPQATSATADPEQSSPPED